VLRGREPALSLDDAKDNCRILEAVMQSAAEGRLIKLI
jgi:xylose dehydrogenase (NAD/NADP)